MNFLFFKTTPILGNYSFMLINNLSFTIYPFLNRKTKISIAYFSSLKKCLPSNKRTKITIS